MELYQLGSDPDFDACLPYTLVEEGGYSNDPHDPGGMTDRGILQREYDRWRRANGLPTQWVHRMSDDEMRTIYHAEYWLPNCQKLPSGLDLSVFDINVNNGVHAGTVLLQRALGIPADGIWGSQTDAAVTSLKPLDVDSIIRRLADLRGAYYQSLRNFRYFGTDWMRRNINIERAALKLANQIDLSPRIS